MNERIVCAAIWYCVPAKYSHQPVNIESGFVISGMRHHNCFTTVAIIKHYFNGILGDIVEKKVQGFITTKHRFVDRVEGFKIAKEANQLIGRDAEIENWLDSSDLY